MDVADVIDRCRRGGVDLRVVTTEEGPRLAIRGTDRAEIDQETRRSIREHKDSIIRFLVDPASTTPTAQRVVPASSPTPTPASKTAPSARHLHPPTGDYRFSVDISPYALAEVDRIRERAHACGWTDPELLQNRGHIAWPCGRDWGLVSFVRHGKRVGEVTADAIELILSSGVRQHFGRRRRT